MKKLIVIFILFCSCTSNKGIKFEMDEKNYIANLPSGFSQQKIIGEKYTEELFIYPNQSIFFITDDTESGSVTNKAKIEEYGTEILIKIAVSDSIDLNGTHKNRTHWREKKSNGIVFGYIQADEFQKQNFDKAIIKFLD